MLENIYLAGFMGTGKSTVGKGLAVELHRPFLDTDALIEQREGRSIGAIFEQCGEAYFRKLEAQTVEEMLPLQGCVVALGGGVLENPLLREKLAASGRLVVLQASGGEILRRLGESEKEARPLLNPEGVEELLAKRAVGYAAGNFHVSTEGKKPEEIAREICIALGEEAWVPSNSPRRVLEARGEGYSYSVIIGAGVLGDPQVWQHLEAPPSLVVGDALTLPLFGQKLPFQKPLHTLPRGEEAKTPESLMKMYGTLLREGVHRGESLVALGGGTVGDAAGFAAATWMRGISYVQCPTTLLSQIDSALGGKTGINLKAGKNLAGAFHQPIAVLADTAALDTLPTREFAAGMAEVVKYGVALDAAFLDWLESRQAAIRARDPAVLEQMIARCCEIKAEVVGQDEREAGRRALLNFGHTLGHAIERTAGYGAVLHGEAVALGMVYALVLSVAACGYPAAEAARAAALLQAFGLPAAPDPAWSWEDLHAAMTVDKKAAGGQVRFVLSQKPGQSDLPVPVPEAELRAAWERWCAHGVGE